MQHSHTCTYESESSQRISLWRWARPDYVVNSDETQCRGLWGARALPSRALSVSIWACVFVISSNWMIITILNENYKLALLICAHTCCRDTAVNSRNEITVLYKTHHRQKVMDGKCYFHPHFVAQLLACVPSFLSPLLDCHFTSAARLICWQVVRVRVNKTGRETERKERGGGERVCYNFPLV